jgi:hypothetical protein
MIHDSAEFPHLAMPIGGIGTGNLAIRADGGLRQWQLHNIGNHSGALPSSFFAIRATRWEPPLDVLRILQAPPSDGTGTPLVTDDVVPAAPRRRVDRRAPGTQRGPHVRGRQQVRTWPNGGRPEVSTRYADEVWTGSEYQVAAHCLWEGLADEAGAVLDAVWARYDGRRRNPYNEIECGDHYVRAMAGWSVLEAMAGFGQDEPAGAFTFRQPDSAVPFLSSHGWGTWAATDRGLALECGGGSMEIRSLTVVGSSTAFEAAVPMRASRCDSGARLDFPGPLTLTAGARLDLVACPW